MSITTLVHEFFTVPIERFLTIVTNKSWNVKKCVSGIVNITNAQRYVTSSVIGHAVTRDVICS